jgi:hypothetical protein
MRNENAEPARSALGCQYPPDTRYHVEATASRAGVVVIMVTVIVLPVILRDKLSQGEFICQS